MSTATSSARQAMSQLVTHVLICDDNRDNALTLGLLLRSEGYIVDLAKDGKEALNLAESIRPHVALLDLLLPDRSGFELAEEFHRRYGNECPVLIAITAHDSAQAQEQAQVSGFHHFVAKPYDPQALLRLVESIDEKAPL
jgi:CheY-like chemotaxis protein